MALEGSIKEFSLPDIFQLIGLQRKTGILHLTSGDKEAVTIGFEGGRVVHADSEVKRLEARLGRLLVKQDKLTPARLEQALRTQEATLQRLGHVLVSTKAITSADLEHALQVQVSQAVFQAFRWRDGDFKFTATESVEYDRDAFRPLSADFILMEGIRMVDEWPTIERKIPSMDLVFRHAAEAYSMLIETGPPPPGDERPDVVRLGSSEARVFERVDGERTVQALVDETGLGDFEVCRSLCELLDRQIIEPAGRTEAIESQAPLLAQSASRPWLQWLPALAGLLVVTVFASRTLTAPFQVYGAPPVLGADSAYWSAGTVVKRETLEKAIDAYVLVRGALPKNLQELVAAHVVGPRAIVDDVGRPFYYAVTADGYTLGSVDRSRKPDPRFTVTRTTRPLS
jgi:hypothetical protein